MTYDYECPGCGDVRTIERKMTDPEDTYICDNCHSTFQRKWSSPTVMFNAPGFYSTDNKRG
jgi:putative FmdB family regulatory protein